MADTASELARLKDLLLRPEANRLEALQTQVGALDARVGSRQALENSTAEILVDAFRLAETQQHRELARAIAPVVVAAIQSEIRNSRDMMVEALYPITGRLVAAAVADAFRGLVAGINQRVDTMMSMRLWKLRVQSWITRRPLSELLLADAARPHLRRILFLERGSGTLLASWASDPARDDRADLVSGMIAAITEFSANAFQSDSGELRTIDMGASRIVLHTSARSIVAGDVAGPMHPEDERAMLEEFSRLAESHGKTNAIGAPDLDLAAARFAALSAPREGKQKNALGIWLVVAALLAALAFWGWRSWTRAQFETGVRGAFSATLAERPQLRAYPLWLNVDHGARSVALSGLAPAQDDAEALQKAVAGHAGSYALTSAVAIVTSEETAARAIATTRGQLAALQAAMTAQAQSLAQLNSELAKLAAAAQSQQAEAAGINARISEIATALQGRIGELQTLAGDPRVALERFLQRNAIFFDRDAVLREPDVAARSLDELARLLNSTKLGIRIVGHASESGSAQLNQKVAQERAGLVARMLAERGIEATRMVIAIRPTGAQIDNSQDGAGHANRRVQFEPLFETEKRAP